MSVLTLILMSSSSLVLFCMHDVMLACADAVAARIERCYESCFWLSKILQRLQTRAVQHTEFVKNSERIETSSD